MPRTAIVNYHVHRPERQAFHIDAGGVVGKMISPELAATSVAVNDARSGEAAVSLKTGSVAFANAPSSVHAFPDDGDWRQAYDQDLTDLLKQEIGAKEVVIFDHTVRFNDLNSERKPARNVHSDYSREGPESRLVDILGPEKADDWAKGHYGFINVWRPVENPINSAPLGFVRPSTASDED